MSVKKYQKARNDAFKTMLLGLVFLIFIPIGIPISFIIMPFLAGRTGAQKLPRNWHLTYTLTVGGTWAIGLVTCIFLVLALALGSSLKLNESEPLILLSITAITWLSFATGVRSASHLSSILDANQDEWNDFDIKLSNNETQTKTTSAAIPMQEEKNLNKESKTSPKKETKKKKFSKNSRFSKLSSKRRK